MCESVTHFPIVLEEIEEKEILLQAHSRVNWMIVKVPWEYLPTQRPDCKVQYSTVKYSTIQYSTVQYSTVQYNTVQYSTAQYSTVQYSTVQYSIVQYSILEY